MRISDNILYETLAPLGNFATSGVIGTAAATVDIASSIPINQTTLGVTLTLPNPTDNINGLIKRVTNIGTVPFTMYGVNIGITEYADFMWIANSWRAPVGSKNVFGNVIAVAQRVPSLTVVTFDGINFRWNGTTDNFQIATVVGTRTVDYTTNINYGVQSGVINGGAGIDGSLQGTPLSLTTSYQVIGDPGIVGIEHRRFNIWDNSSNFHYLVNAIRKGTTTTDGWVTIWVEKIALSAPSISPTVPSNTIRFTTGATYVPSAGMKYAIVEILGGSGGSGGSVATAANNSAASGGSAGSYAKFMATAAQIGASVVITIGAAGNTSVGGPGTAGGTTSFGALASAPGGLGGLVSPAGSWAVAQGAASPSIPTVTTGQIIVIKAGNPGGGAIANAGAGNPHKVDNGANSEMGSGGQGQASLTNTNSVPAIGFGAGPSGNTNSATSGAKGGTAGLSGICVVTEYF